jgi:PKD repeat protein
MACSSFSVNAQCISCPQYDFAITPTSSWQTSSSSISSFGCKVYEVQVVSGLSYIFKTGCGNGANANYDTYIELYDATCGYLAGNDDACEELRSEIGWSASYTGVAYVSVRGFSSSAGDYTMAYRSCDASALFTFESEGATVSFTASSIQSGNTYFWDFGDGTTATGASVSHTFECGYGSYVSLTASAPTGCSVTDYQYVQPEGGISAAFTYQQDGSTFSFDATASASDLVYFWDFGDGSTSDLPEPVHTYGCGGDFWIFLEVNDPVSGCYAYAYDYVYVEGEVIAPTFTYVVNGSTVSFMANAPGAESYLWDFGNGDQSTVQNPTYTYQCAGGQSVSLMVTDANGCQGFYWDFFEVAGELLPVDFTYSVNGLNVSFTGPVGGGVNSWYWYFDDGNSSDLQNPSHTYSCPGTYYVEVSVSNDAGCYNYGYQLVVVEGGLPSFTFTQTGNTVNFSAPSQGVVEWFWDFGDGVTSSQQNPVYTFTSCGTYYVALYLSLSNGCSAYYFEPVQIEGNVHVEAMSNGPICPGDNITLSATAIQFAVYQWQGPNGFASDFSSVTISNATEAMSGTYELTVYDALGCPNNASVEVVVDVPSNEVTLSGTVLQAASGMASYFWTNCGTGLSIPAQTASLFAPSTNGSYSVTVTNTTGCTATSVCVAVTNVGLAESEAGMFSVHPNPSAGVFRIEGATDIMSIHVTDALGRSVWRGSLAASGIIDLSGMPSGLYMLNVTTAEGSAAYRLVKQ